MGLRYIYLQRKHIELEERSLLREVRKLLLNDDYIRISASTKIIETRNQATILRPNTVPCTAHLSATWQRGPYLRHRVDE